MAQIIWLTKERQGQAKKGDQLLPTLARTMLHFINESLDEWKAVLEYNMGCDPDNESSNVEMEGIKSKIAVRESYKQKLEEELS